MDHGPIQALVLGFPDIDLLEGQIAEELAHLSDSGQIRIIDAVFVLRDGDEVHGLSVSNLDEEERSRLRAAVGALIGLGLAGADGAILGGVLGATTDPDAPSAAELVAADIATDLPTGTAALVLAVEHLWAAPLAAAIREARGVVLGKTMVTPEKLIDLGFALREA
jgi:hypothetical protein